MKLYSPRAILYNLAILVSILLGFSNVHAEPLATDLESNNLSTPLLDSAKAYEDREDYPQAIEFYNQALVAYPELSPIIHQILSTYEQNLELQHESTIDLDRANAAIQNSVLADMAKTHLGFYFNSRMGYNKNTNKLTIDSEITTTFYLGLGGGYRFDIGHGHNDLGMYYNINRDQYFTYDYAEELPMRNNDKALNPEVYYIFNDGDWTFFQDFQRTTTRQAQKGTVRTSTSTQSTSYPTSISVLSFNFFKNPHLEQDFEATADINFTQNSDLSLAYVDKFKINSWLMIKASLALGMASDLFKSPLYTTYTRNDFDTLQNHLDNTFSQWLDSTSTATGSPIKIDSTKYHQVYEALEIKPSLSWKSLKFDLGTKLSYYREMVLENYYQSADGAFAGNVIQVPTANGGVTNWGIQANSASDTIAFRLDSLSPRSHHPAWLNLDLRPNLTATFSDHVDLNITYEYSFDLWRDDYVLNPNGHTITDHYNQIFSLALDIKF